MAAEMEGHIVIFFVSFPTQNSFLSLVAKVVPVCMGLGAAMELFMIKTGFCKSGHSFVPVVLLKVFMGVQRRCMTD